MRTVPEWAIQLSWTLCGIFSTGAVWYFLALKENTYAALSVMGAVLFSGLSIYLHRLRDRRTVPVYRGLLDQNFADFIYQNEASVFRLEVQLDDKQSTELSNWLREEKSDPVIWFSVAHDEYGTEFGFHRNDPEIHWNTRFWDSIHTEGYFKVHSIQGPYQGWMSVTLRAVGREHVDA